jgi:glucose-6-phosphate 1-dehydrogenase
VSSSFVSSTGSSSPIFNAVHVERVEVESLERLTLEGRISYHDRAGALKDMSRTTSHGGHRAGAHGAAGQARTGLAPSRPSRSPTAVATPTAERVRQHGRARYTAGMIGSRNVPT